ncbi:unnamed protein product [Toxocara canis]|uniref:Transposase n=1 Tax=Toxocara canis TaxID=6265 RepID=A0A183UPF9_TOXCA|nr:unnamed protein product [Toxocara canis]
MTSSLSHLLERRRADQSHLQESPGQWRHTAKINLPKLLPPFVKVKSANNKDNQVRGYFECDFDIDRHKGRGKLPRCGYPFATWHRLHNPKQAPIPTR